MGGLGHCFNHIKYYISLSPHERIYTDWWYTYPSEKYERQLGWLFQIYGKTHVPTHQPVWIPRIPLTQFFSWFINPINYSYIYHKPVLTYPWWSLYKPVTSNGPSTQRGRPKKRSMYGICINTYHEKITQAQVKNDKYTTILYTICCLYSTQLLSRAASVSLGLEKGTGGATRTLRRVIPLQLEVAPRSVPIGTWVAVCLHYIYIYTCSIWE